MPKYKPFPGKRTSSGQRAAPTSSGRTTVPTSSGHVDIVLTDVADDNGVALSVSNISAATDDAVAVAEITAFINAEIAVANAAFWEWAQDLNDAIADPFNDGVVNLTDASPVEAKTVDAATVEAATVEAATVDAATVEAATVYCYFCQGGTDSNTVCMMCAVAPGW